VFLCVLPGIFPLAAPGLRLQVKRPASPSTFLCASCPRGKTGAKHVCGVVVHRSVGSNVFFCVASLAAAVTAVICTPVACAAASFSRFQLELIATVIQHDGLGASL